MSYELKNKIIMKHVVLYSIFLLMSLSSFSQEEKQKPTSDITTYYLIRHAEKDRSDAKEQDPHLKAEGLKRAENWSVVLGNLKFDAIYSTNYLRTKETAQPTANKNNLEITLYQPNPKDMDAFKKENEGKTVLIVGHSNTIPDFVNALIGEKTYEDIDDSNNGNLYIVTCVGITDVAQVLTIN